MIRALPIFIVVALAALGVWLGRNTYHPVCGPRQVPAIVEDPHRVCTVGCYRVTGK